MMFLYSNIFLNLSRKFKFHLNRTAITDNLHEDQNAVLITSRSVLRMRNISEKVVEKVKTHILCSVTFFFFFFSKIVSFMR